MTAWDIYSYDFEGAGPHPAVIISHPDRVAKAQWVNVLLCTTQRASRPPKENEVRLNGADGLDWETLCRCDALWLVEKNKLQGKRGTSAGYAAAKSSIKSTPPWAGNWFEATSRTSLKDSYPILPK